MNVLVLGGNGFIGSHLVDKLLFEGHTVRVFDKNEEHFRKSLKDVDYHIGEFGNRGLLLEALVGMDVVVHLISTTLPKTSNDDPVFDVQTNIIETLFLLEQCILKSVKKIVFASSGGTVYGIPKNIPVGEENATNPICSYGITKLTIEKYLNLFKRLYNLNYAIIRPSNPFGSRQNPFGIQGVIPVFLGKIIRNETIHIWGNGNVVRDFIYVNDLVDAFYRVITYNTNSNVFNIGSGEGYSLNDLLTIMKNVTGRDLSVEYTKSRTYDVPKIYLDISRARKELNWEPRTTLQEGIKLTWEYITHLSDFE
jgi:UDP-glucose 4-epimerase